MQKYAVLLLGCALLLLSERAAAQSHDSWWSWALPTVEPEQARHYDERGRDERRSHRGASRRDVHVPRGHLPPRGECRLWYYDRPPGHQPPPVPCSELSARRSSDAVVVTHRGVEERRYRRRPRSPRPRTRRTKWEVVVWGDVVFRRSDRRATGEVIGSAGIEMVLGRSVVDRLRRERSRGRRHDLRGRWIKAGQRGRALQVRAGGVPLAEFSDVDGDGRVDAVLLPTGGR